MKGQVAILTSDQILEIEKKALSQGISSKELMENAGEALFNAIDKLYPSQSFVVVIGKGNNGGDGLCLAKHLLRAKKNVHVYSLYPEDKLSSLAQEHLKTFKNEKGKFLTVDSADQIKVEKNDVIIDGILGIGSKGSIEGLLLDVILHLNGSLNPIVAIDVPSGLHPDTGNFDPLCIKASYTLTLGFAKKGFFFGKGFEMCGKIMALPIGFESLLEESSQCLWQLTLSSVAPLIPKIKRTRHKYERGHVLCVAGSKEMPGAAMLSSFAALRAGAGMCTLFYPIDAESSFASSHFEIIKKPIEDINGSNILAEMAKARAVIIGPGLGRDLNVTGLLKHLLQEVTLPMVIDADALYFLASFPNFSIRKNSILTPHKKEMLRLLGMSSQPSDEEFHQACLSFANEKECVLVVKGAPTFIYSKNNPVYVSTFGDPGMATAGSGDVLSGIIGAELAQGLSPLDAALFGVVLHGLSGEIAKVKNTSYAMIATDIIEALPKAFKRLT